MGDQINSAVKNPESKDVKLKVLEVKLCTVPLETDLKHIIDGVGVNPVPKGTN